MMDQRVKVLASKSGGLSLVPGTNMVEGVHTQVVTGAYSHTQRLDHTPAHGHAPLSLPRIYRRLRTLWPWSSQEGLGSLHVLCPWLAQFLMTVNLFVPHCHRSPQAKMCPDSVPPWGQGSTWFHRCPGLSRTWWHTPVTTTHGVFA